MRNPFKLWGSWIGAGIGLGYFVLLDLLPRDISLVLDHGLIPIIFPLVLLSKITGIGMGFFYFLLPVALIIDGFIIGWLIHLLILHFKNKGENQEQIQQL